MMMILFTVRLLLAWTLKIIIFHLLLRKSATRYIFVALFYLFTLFFYLSSDLALNQVAVKQHKQCHWEDLMLSTSLLSLRKTSKCGEKNICLPWWKNCVMNGKELVTTIHETNGIRSWSINHLAKGKSKSLKSNFDDDTENRFL